jgi:hypothetical protein
LFATYTLPKTLKDGVYDVTMILTPGSLGPLPTDDNPEMDLPIPFPFVYDEPNYSCYMAVSSNAPAGVEGGIQDPNNPNGFSVYNAVAVTQGADDSEHAAVFSVRMTIGFEVIAGGGNICGGGVAMDFIPLGLSIVRDASTFKSPSTHWSRWSWTWQLFGNWLRPFPPQQPALAAAPGKRSF